MKSKRNLGFTTVALLLFLACNTEKKQSEEESQEPTKEIEAPEKIISIDEAKNGYDNYTQKRVNLIEAAEEPSKDGTKFVASRYGEYDIETVKTYIAYVEQEAKAAGVEIKTLRFYFSTYPDKEEYSKNKKIKHPRQNTFFILPTMKVDTLNLGFYIKNLGDGKKEAALIRDYPSKLKKGMGYTKTTQKSYASLLPSFNLNTFQGEGSLILNDSHMSPPPEEGSDF
jgi:hypothetical protein